MMLDPQQTSDVACTCLGAGKTAAPWFLQVGQTILGAILAILGGFFALIVRLRLERKQEIEYIKVSLLDELKEIVSIVDRMCETHNATASIPPKYLNELAETTEAFDLHKKRLFIISDASLRKQVVDFYKKLDADIANARATVGILAPAAPSLTPVQSTTEVTSKFIAIKQMAEALEEKLKSYKFTLLRG